MEENKLTNFLIKLWSILEDESIIDTICWDRTGKSFHIYDMYKFCEVVLPRFFKHKNMASFVRQLNLYGFKKIATVDRSTLLYNDNLSDHMQFAHPFFRHGKLIYQKQPILSSFSGHPHLLKDIKRNYTAPKRQALGHNHHSAGTPKPQDMDLSNNQQQEKMVTLPEDDLLCLLEELQHLRMGHGHMENTICDLTRDNELLWNEVSLLRDSHLKQQENVGKLVKFLISLVQNNANVAPKLGRMSGAKRMVPIGEINNPLAVAAASPALENWDVLSNIQEDILSEALNYSNMSALPPPSETQMHPSSPPPTSSNQNNINSMKFEQRVVDQRQKFPTLSKDSLPKGYANNSMMSPRHQLSMHLNPPKHFAHSPDNKAVLQLSSPERRSPPKTNNQQLVQASSELIQMGRPYKVPQSKITSNPKVQMKQQYKHPSIEYQDDNSNYVEEYYYDDGQLAGPSSSYEHHSHQPQEEHHLHSEFMDEDEVNDSYVMVEDPQMHDQEQEATYLGLSPGGPSPDGHEIMLYDALNGIIEQTGWEDN